MRGRTIIVSAVIHVGLFGLAMHVATGRALRRATSVAVVNGEKKKQPKKEPPPRPKPMIASARPEPPRAAAAPRLAPAHTSEAPAPAPVDTGLQMGNDEGPGIAIGGPAAPKTQAAPAAGPREHAAPVKKEKVVAPKANNPEEDHCTEAPSKPMPVQRPSEIEYTQEARANGIEGRLVLKVTVGADGAVADVQVVSGVDPQLDAAAIAAVKTWVFKPSMRCGKAMAGGTFTLARRFELGD